MSTVLFLGATSDMAISTARLFAQRGHAIQLAGRDIQALQRIADDLRVRYRSISTIHPFDVTAYDGHATFFSSLDPRPDVVICFVGVLGDHRKAMTDPEEGRRIIESNYTGVVSILTLVAAAFRERRSGTIICISSVAGDRGRGSSYYYGSSKAGLTAFLSGLRNRHYSSGVHVITVKPGYVATKMTSHLRLPPLLTSSTEGVAEAIYKGFIKKRNVLYVKGLWRLVMLAIIHIPENIFKKMRL